MVVAGWAALGPNDLDMGKVAAGTSKWKELAQGQVQA